VKHLVDRCKCLSLFATHYHSLLTEWNEHRMVRLGHMECLVGNGEESGGQDEADHDITFLYSLGEGTCPKSFGINVARLAGLPEAVLQKAKRISSSFEQEMNSGASSSKITARTAPAIKKQLYEAIHSNDWEKVKEIWQSLQ
jgi:DNA mismatch repair protein MSH6